MGEKPGVLTKVNDFIAREIYYVVHERDNLATVREVLIVIVILGVLFLMAVPTVGPGLRKDKERASAANASNLALAMFNYQTDNGYYPSGKTSTEAFKSLFPTYIQNPANLFLTTQRRP